MANLEKNLSDLDAKTESFLNNEDLDYLFPDQDEKEIASIIEVIDVLNKMSNLAQLRDDSAFEIIEIVNQQWKSTQAEDLEAPASRVAEILSMLKREFGAEKLRFAKIAVSIGIAVTLLLLLIGPKVSTSILALNGNTASNLSDSVTSNLPLSTGLLGVVIVAAVAIIVVISRRK